ncbi:MAG TPA: GLPGLI family protein [Candidatus Alistipes avistercoris]|nr:GLPGLI family protein [Candidatus Alistipes avistercoris]
MKSLKANRIEKNPGKIFGLYSEKYDCLCRVPVSSGTRYDPSIMKKLLLSFVLFLACGPVCGQTLPLVCERDLATRKVIDTCLLEVGYMFRYSRDTLDRQAYFDRTVLSVGRKYAHYYSAGAARIDTLTFRARRQGHETLDLDRAFAPDEKPCYCDVYTDYPSDGRRRVVHRLWESDYEYEEPVEPLYWSFDSVSCDSLLGYSCFRAVCTWRGRRYTAWYAPDLPMRYGPWKFGGLPGLILAVEESEGLFSWKASHIAQPEGKPLWIYDPSIGGDIGHRSQRVTRRQWLRMEKMQWQEPVALMRMLNIKTLIEKEGRYVAPEPGDIEVPYIPPLERE